MYRLPSTTPIASDKCFGPKPPDAPLSGGPRQISSVRRWPLGGAEAVLAGQAERWHGVALRSHWGAPAHQFDFQSVLHPTFPIPPGFKIDPR